MPGWAWFLVAVGALGLVACVHDLVQRRHAILRNFPIIGHLRYLLEAVGPELRQYIVTDNRQERPFDRDQRRWIYASAKGANNNFAFGSDEDLEQTPDHVIIDHSMFPLPRPDADDDRLPCAKVLGDARDRRERFRPASLVNVSAMSYGALSGAAVEAIDRGCALAGCLHNAGEGGISPHHLHGGDLVFQIGTGYFGCRDRSGRFDLDRLEAVCAQHPVRAIEIKLSQGAKPGLGGVLPAVKVTPAIAAARDVEPGRDCRSPSAHTAFGGVDSMLDFVERIADRTGLPVGIKSAVGSSGFWAELADLMATGERGVDFVTVDGGEGGSGDAPLAFSDHVALPFKLGFTRAYRAFAERGVADRVVFVGSGRLGLPEAALVSLALGCDMVNVAREAMLAIGCIQAQRCHTNRCPAGITTQSRWLARGLDPTLKSVRLANYVAALRHELLELSHACGVSHPRLVGADRIEILDGHLGSRSLRACFDYGPGWADVAEADRPGLDALMQAPVPTVAGGVGGRTVGG
jgi:glutamate synthase domain-containing protein 2